MDKKEDKMPKLYQRKLRDVGLYKGPINGIWSKESIEADSLFGEFIKKGLNDAQIFQKSLGAPEVDDWGKFIRSGSVKKKSNNKVFDKGIKKKKNNY